MAKVPLKAIQLKKFVIEFYMNHCNNLRPMLYLMAKTKQHVMYSAHRQKLQTSIVHINSKMRNKFSQTQTNSFYSSISTTISTM